VMMDLTLNLCGIVAQQLIPRVDGHGRRAAIEVMLNSPLMSELILRGEVSKMKELMKRSGEMGMRTFDQHLYELCKRGEISEEQALRHADSANEVRLMLKLGGNKRDLVSQVEAAGNMPSFLE